MMNSLQIDKILKKNNEIKRCFSGVFSSNNIKIERKKYPIALVANTDKEGQIGTHWVGIYIINHNNAEYFDSFAMKPNMDIAKFLAQFKNIKMNTSKLQSEFDNSCGSHVIYFIINRCRGVSFESIIRSLSSTGPYSDSFVKLFVYELISAENSI